MRLNWRSLSSELTSLFKARNGQGLILESPRSAKARLERPGLDFNSLRNGGLGMDKTSKPQTGSFLIYAA